MKTAGVGEPEAPESGPFRTEFRGCYVNAVRSMGQLALPLVVGIYTIGSIATGSIVLVPLAGAFVSAMLGFSILAWWRRTYITGPEDIRLEQGIVSRSARSVPFERIQDVSVEQKFLARLFGLAEVRFETGAGGKDEILLTYVTLHEAERLRELVRARKDGESLAVGAAGEELPAAPPPPLFAMDNRRVVTFGLFSFSLVVFAVLFGAVSQFEALLPFEMWDWNAWLSFLEGHEKDLEGIGPFGGIVAAIGLVLFVALLGVITGIVLTFSREYGFTLERTPKGFRRRRGLFNKTDVVLPVHRVQAARIESRLIRKRFGWYSLEFVSLAQDTKQSSNHAIAPFAKLDEIWPVAHAAGIELPSDELDWHRPTLAPWVAQALVVGGALILWGTIYSAIVRSALPSAIGLALAAAAGLANYFAWRRHRHASDDVQLYVETGRLAPRLAIAQQVKLQSVEIVQGPLARKYGYATVNLGLAGGKLDIPNIPLAEARALRQEIVDKMAAVDFAQLPR